jgi:alkanesulfonate monooxygenase SsuD/methylene tetrahydromethanopterin reductase-like flavin-dependent oxidoreductase (luciferase family)
MKFGTYYFFQAHPRYSHAEIIHRELEQMVWTEELGYDSVWLTEHHFIDYGLSVDPLMLACAGASRTQRIRFGLAAAILPFHNPLRLAEQVALVDIISNGRLDMGVGRGNRPEEFRAFQKPQHENREMFEESLEILTRAWTQDAVEFEGRHFRVPPGVRVMPKPIQKPLPIYQVCVSKESIENTALRGWPMLNSILYGTLDKLPDNREIYVQALDKTDFSDEKKRWLLERWGVSRHVYVAETDKQALEDTKEAEMWYQESLRKFQLPERIEDVHPSLQPGFRAQAERLAKVNWEDLVRETVAFGSPDTVAKKLEPMRAMGIGQVLAWQNFGGLPQTKIRRSMELFAREVMPRFR